MPKFEITGENGAYFGDEDDVAKGIGEGGNPESLYEVSYVGETERAAEEAGSRGAGILTAEMEDPQRHS